MILDSRNLENYDIAAIDFDQVIYLTYFRKNLTAPSTSVVKLIQEIYEEFGNQSQRVLRNKIFTTEHRNELSHSFVKVAAKRIEFNFNVKNVLTANRKIITLGDPNSPLYRRRSPPAGRDSSIGIKVFSKEGQLLAQAENMNRINKTLHAEVMAVQSFFETFNSKIPLGAKIEVTHKPCKMCAAILAHWSEDPKTLQVTYHHDVKGRCSVNTEFDRLGIQVQS